MNKRLVVRLLGAIMLIEAAAMIPSLLISLYYGDGDHFSLLLTIGLLCLLGLPAWLLARPRDRDLRAREGFVVVALSWLILSAFGALPFVFSGILPHYADAFFEAVSGFTTTGASVISHFDNLGKGASGAAVQCLNLVFGLPMETGLNV